MASVFVSYSRRDWAIANALVGELKARGYEVWWDRELLGGGDFRDQIRNSLDAAKASIVIWSESAARSDWVLGEAARAAQENKLVPTRLPDYSAAEVPAEFHNIQTEVVTDLERICTALTAKGVLPNPVASHIPRPAISVDKAVARQKRAEEQQVSFFLPIAIMVLGMFLGIGTLFAADAINIGIFKWRPVDAPHIVKEVGYFWAFNWTLAAVLLLPLAWALVVLSVGCLLDARQKLALDQMIVTPDLEPITPDDARLKKLFRDVRRITLGLMAAITALILIFAWYDYSAVVARAYDDSALAGQLARIHDGGIALDHVKYERDWSIAAVLDRSASSSIPVEANRWFAWVLYLIYPGFGVGFMFSYFVALVGLGMFFLPTAARQYGLTIVPDVDSEDPRRGFQVFADLFGHTMSIMAVCFCLCYLMAVQNLYLRVPDATLLRFLAPDLAGAVSNFAAGKIDAGLDDLIGNTFSSEMPYGAVQSVAAWFVLAFMAVSFVGIAYLFLRASALRGRALLRRKLESGGIRSVYKITDLDEQKIRERLNSMEAWPLSWPRLNQLLLAYCLLVGGLIFYKLGVIFVIGALWFALYNTFRTVADESEVR